jgi:hypothetical protein
MNLRLGARNMSSTPTGTQVGSDLDTLGYEIISLAVVVLESIELNLTQIYTSAFNSVNIKGGGNTEVSR